MRCKGCGFSLSDDARFCDQCGAPVDDAAKTGRRKMKRGAIIGACACAVVVCIGGMAWALASGLSDGEGAQDDESAEVDQADASAQEAVRKLDLSDEDARPQADTNADSAEVLPDEEPPAPVSTLTTYQNARFGCSVGIPSSCVQIQDSDNGDGAVFVDDALGMQVMVWGSNNVLGSGVQQISQNLSAGHGVAYEYQGDDHCIVSYEEGGTITYIKEYVGPGSVCGVQITYPSSSAPTCNALVEQIIPTFSPGDVRASY